MMNLSQDLLAKLEASGFQAVDVCERADVSTSTITVMRRKGQCSQRTYDKMHVALIEMCRERNDEMKEAGLHV